MIKLATVLLSVFLSTPALAQSHSHYKGYEKIDKKIMGSIFKRVQDRYGLANFIDSQFSSFSPGLPGLMGYYSGDIDKGQMTNGDPNAISFLVHYLIFNEVSLVLADDCGRVDDPLLKDNYHEAFLETFTDVCETPIAEKLSEDQYFDFWGHFFGFMAPMQEFEAWVEKHEASQYQDEAERIHAMTLTLLLNPYFILEN